MDGMKRLGRRDVGVQYEREGSESLSFADILDRRSLFMNTGLLVYFNKRNNMYLLVYRDKLVGLVQAIDDLAALSRQCSLRVVQVKINNYQSRVVQL